MPYIAIPPVEKVPDGATEEERMKMFKKWIDKVRRCNPRYSKRIDRYMKKFDTK